MDFGGEKPVGYLARFGTSEKRDPGIILEDFWD